MKMMILRTWKRLRPQATMNPRHRNARLLPATFIILALILLLRRSSNSPPAPQTTAKFISFSRPDFEHPPLRAVVICDPDTQLSTLQRTIASIRGIPVTIHHFGPPSFNDSGIEHVIHTSRRPYEDPVRVLHPPALYLRAGSVLSEAAVSWLVAARQAYAARPDIAGFSLASTAVREKVSGEDHDSSSWREVRTQSPFAYGLLANGDGFFPNVGKDLAVWETFSEWLLLRRSDWYRYPSGEGVDGTPLGYSGRTESKWTRAAWNVWFSKFMAEYKLRVVYSGISGLIQHDGEGVLYKEGKDFTMRNVEAFDGTGKPVKNGMYKPETVKQIVDLGRRQGGMVSFTLVNKVFLDTARSWLCNVDVAKMRPRGLLWAVTDPESKKEMASVENSEAILLDEVKGGKETGHNFGNPGYWRLMLERTSLIGEILRQGIALFAFETDAIWLEDPQPYIDELVSQDADIVGTINTREEVSGNFFYLRPTLATRRVWDEITTRFEAAYKAVNWSAKTVDSWTYIENDQSQLTKLVLRNDSWRRSYPVSFLTLDMELFVDGRWYKPDEGYYTSKRAREPVVINNNFAIGISEKTERAKEYGHWFWDEQEKTCMIDLVGKAVRESRKR